jgi:hypothetical protein
MAGRGTATVVAAAIVALVGSSVGSACRAPGGPSPDTALVTVDDRDLTIELESCGRDGGTVFVLGEGDGAVLQLVLEVEGADEPDLSDDDGEDGGVTVLDGGVGFSLVFEEGEAIGAFGERAAEGAGVPGGPTGSIASARIDGSRIRVSGQADVLDAANQGTGEPGGRVSIDANCPDPSDLQAGPAPGQAPLPS